MNGRFFAKAAVAFSTGIPVWDEQRRINEWIKNNEGKELEMKHQNIAGTFGYSYPVEKNSTRGNGPGR